jgi:hypothetical protein
MILDQDFLSRYAQVFAHFGECVSFRPDPVGRAFAIRAAAHDERCEFSLKYRGTPVSHADIIAAEHYYAVGRTEWLINSKIVPYQFGRLLGAVVSLHSVLLGA